MSEKHDRTYARTAQDIERKYSFGKTFADMLGLVNDNRDKVDEVESSLRNEITEQSTSIRRDTEKIVFEATETIKEDGVNKVTTTTGYTFDNEGMKISKTGEEMQNLLDNTGMYVTRSGTSVLTANNAGVEALNGAVKTWMIVGENSRFEDYGLTRTGCFWIGG